MLALTRGSTRECLVKDVLAEVLGTYGDDLRNGRFPSQLLLNQMQGPHLTPMVRDGLRQQNSEQADRQLAILELWGKGNAQPADLAEEPVYRLRDRQAATAGNIPTE